MTVAARRMPAVRAGRTRARARRPRGRPRSTAPRRCRGSGRGRCPARASRRSGWSSRRRRRCRATATSRPGPPADGCRVPGGPPRGVHPDPVDAGQVERRRVTELDAGVGPEREVVRRDRCRDLVAVDGRTSRSSAAIAIASPPMPHPRSATDAARRRRSGRRAARRREPGRLLEPGLGEEHPAREVAELAPGLLPQLRLGQHRRDQRRGRVPRGAAGTTRDDLAAVGRRAGVRSSSAMPSGVSS